MLNKKLNIILIVVITSIVSITGYEFISDFFERKNSNYNLQQKKVITNKAQKPCPRAILSPRETFPNWKTYSNNEYCFSFQYPPGWHLLESLEHIGPYIALSDKKIKETDQLKKIIIGIKNDELFTSFLLSQTFLANPKIINLWHGSQPAFRLSGYLEESAQDKQLPYAYSDSILIPREDKTNINFVLQYVEAKKNESYSEVFDKIYQSFNIVN